VLPPTTNTGFAARRRERKEREQDEREKKKERWGREGGIEIKIKKAEPERKRGKKEYQHNHFFLSQVHSAQLLLGKEHANVGFALDAQGRHRCIILLFKHDFHVA